MQFLTEAVFLSLSGGVGGDAGRTGDSVVGELFHRVQDSNDVVVRGDRAADVGGGGSDLRDACPRTVPRHWIQSRL